MVSLENNPNELSQIKLWDGSRQKCEILFSLIFSFSTGNSHAGSNLCPMGHVEVSLTQTWRRPRPLPKDLRLIEWPQGRLKSLSAEFLDTLFNIMRLVVPLVKGKKFPFFFDFYFFFFFEMNLGYNNFKPYFRTSRPWRSNSLTPPATDQHLSASPTDHWCQYQNKGRSHSLTYVRDSTTSEASISPASSVSMIEEKEVEEIVKTLPEGCGMKGQLGFSQKYLA